MSMCRILVIIGIVLATGSVYAADLSLDTEYYRLIKIGAKVVKHTRHVTFQMAEVLVSKRLFQEILERIHRLKPVPIGYG